MMPTTIRKNFHILCSNMLLFIAVVMIQLPAYSQKQKLSSTQPLVAVGVASVDITPEGPIRLSGYAARSKTETAEVIHRLHAKALAFGTDEEERSVFITVDLVGIPGSIWKELAETLSAKVGLAPSNLVISSSHTHGSPEVGNLMNILQYRGEMFSDSLLSREQLSHIAAYRQRLLEKLETVAINALKDRKPSLVSWGQGQAQFAKNRRTEGGPVDPSLPLLRVGTPDGKLRAVLVNYACHGTTLGGTTNKIHADWMGEAQKFIEASHPGAIAMVAIGCGADANPNPRGTVELMTKHGQEIAANVEKLLTAQLQPLTAPPVAKLKWIELPFAHVSTEAELLEMSKDNSIKGYYSRLALERNARGYEIPATLTYPVQTWTFGDKLAMINLAGEVVVDYAIRLKNELGADRVWINAYSNDVPSYIASKRVLKEGGYEAETSMYWYDKPSPFSEEVEDIIIDAVKSIIPASYKHERAATNTPTLVAAEEDGVIQLRAEQAYAIGPEIAYMPEWEAFGWFTELDRVEWDVDVDKKGKYDVYLDWSVSDETAGKPFVFEAGKRTVTGKVARTGSWFTYRKERIGTIQLAEGTQKVIFRPASESEKGALMDLREITLVPTK